MWRGRSLGSWTIWRARTRREGVGVLTILEGVEVALWRAGVAGAEFAVAVCAAVCAAAHGPGATVGGLATDFLWVSWHGGVIIARMF